MPTPKWLTGRTRTPTFTLSFSIDVEWAPLVGTRVHYLKYGSVFAAADAAYVTTPSPTIGSGLRGPYVSITPEVRKVAGSDTNGPSPYKPDSPEGYVWEPSGDPGGGWVEWVYWPLHRVQFGWNITIFGGDGSSLIGGGWIPDGGEVTVWAPGGSITSPGPMGGISYSGSGVPIGVTIPAGRTSWTAPDDWERTGGTAYSHSLSGTIVFNGGQREEYFINLDQPTAINNTLTGVPAGHVSEIGSRNPNDPGPPWARQYTEQRAAGSTQSVSVDCGSVGSWSITTAANGTMPNSNFLTPFAQATAFTHTLGTGGSATSANCSISVSLDIGGVSVSPIAFSYSNSDGAASEAGATATSFTVSGSPAWPGSPNQLPGGGQVYRGGIKIGNAASSLKIVIPETIIWNGEVKRLPNVGNDVSYDLQIDAYQPSGGVAPTVLSTISGITNTFSQTFSYDNRAGFASTRLGSATTHASGGNTWSVNRPSTWPSNAGCRLAGTNATGLPTRRLSIRGKLWSLYRAYAPNVVPIVPDDAGTWPARTDGTGMTSSIVSGKLRLVSTAAAFARFPITVPIPEYRLHKIRLRSVGSANQSLRIRRVGALGSPAQHSFDWFATTGADAAWVEVDLDPLAAYPGPCHAIGAGIVLQGTPGYYWQLDTGGAGTIEVEWLRAVVRTFATLDCIRRDMIVDAAALVGTIDGSPYQLLLDSTDNLLGKFGGWKITPDAMPSGSKPWGHDVPYNLIIDDAGPFPQADWYDADNYDYVAGTGLLKDEGTWTTYLNREAMEPGIDPEAVVIPEEPPTLLPAHAVPAQELLERVILYPGAGDVFGYGSGAYGTSTTISYGLLLGAAVHGLELGEIEDGADWPDIVALDGTVERARGEALGAEHYALLTPDLRNAVSYSGRLDPEDDTAQRLTITGVDKKVFRTLWLLLLNLSDPLTVDTVRRRIISAQGKRLACYHAEDRTIDTLSGEHPPARWLSLDIDPHTCQLWALGKLGGELAVYVSEDWGDTIWEVRTSTGEVLRVTGKSGVVIADPVRGVTATYYEDAAGAVQQLLRLPDGTTVGPTAVQLAGAALTAKVVGSAMDSWAAGRHLLKVRQGGTLKVIAGQDLAGATFELWIV